MFSIKEAAEIFGVHYQTMRKWIKTGFIKAISYDKVVRISQEEIDRLKAGGCNGIKSNKD